MDGVIDFVAEYRTLLHSSYISRDEEDRFAALDRLVASAAEDHQRAFERVLADASVTVRLLTTELYGRVVDISAGGLQARIAGLAASAGCGVQYAALVVDSGERAYRFWTRLAWSARDHHGFEFLGTAVEIDRKAIFAPLDASDLCGLEL